MKKILIILLLLFLYFLVGCSDSDNDCSYTHEVVTEKSGTIYCSVVNNYQWGGALYADGCSDGMTHLDIISYRNVCNADRTKTTNCC